MAEAEKLLPGFKTIWKQIKEETKSKQRISKTIEFSDEPEKIFSAFDGDLIRVFALNLETLEVSNGIHVSTGEWACHGGNNHDAPITGIPPNMAVVVFTWNDFYRTSTLKIQVSKLPEQLK